MESFHFGIVMFYQNVVKRWRSKKHVFEEKAWTLMIRSGPNRLDEIAKMAKKKKEATTSPLESLQMSNATSTSMPTMTVLTVGKTMVAVDSELFTEEEEEGSFP